jgi:hypothetical protein
MIALKKSDALDAAEPLQMPDFDLCAHLAELKSGLSRISIALKKVCEAAKQSEKQLKLYAQLINETATIAEEQSTKETSAQQM